jgi:hypothetical protein
MSTKLPGAKLRQAVIDRISSDFKLHIRRDTDRESGQSRFTYHPHKHLLVLRSREFWDVVEGVTVALTIQLGCVYSGKGPIEGLGDLLDRVPGVVDLYNAWKSNLLRAAYSGAPQATA